MNLNNTPTIYYVVRIPNVQKIWNKTESPCSLALWNISKFITWCSKVFVTSEKLMDNKIIIKNCMMYKGNPFSAYYSFRSHQIYQTAAYRVKEKRLSDNKVVTFQNLDVKYSFKNME